MAVRIPKVLALDIGLRSDAPVDLFVEGGALVIRPVNLPAYTLDGLLSGVSEQNIHGETNMGGAAGAEEW